MSKGPEWLLDELPALQAEGVIDAATAERLRARYAAQAAARTPLARVLFAALGALLIGMGLILLIAHNWDAWPRALRLTVAFLPLLVGQGLCAIAIVRHRDSVAWAEGAGLFTAAAFAAALALVGQIFHFPGDLGRYLLTCALAALPLVYLLRASGVAALVALALLGWVQAEHWGEHSPLWVFALYAALVPHALQAWRRDPESFRAAFLAGWLVPTAFIALLIALPNGLRLSWLWFTEVAALLWLLEMAGPRTPALRLRRPLQGYGLIGVGASGLAAAFGDFWQHRAWFPRAAETTMAEGWIVVGLVLAAVLFLALRSLWRRQWLAAAGALPALAVWATLVFDPAALATPLALLFNAYVLAVGLALIQRGLAERSMAAANTGLSLIAMLVLMRFFDGDWSFTVRGIGFVVVGAGFLFANVWLKRRVQS